jgi:hypothetical protein
MKPASITMHIGNILSEGVTIKNSLIVQDKGPRGLYGLTRKKSHFLVWRSYTLVWNKTLKLEAD